MPERSDALNWQLLLPHVSIPQSLTIAVIGTIAFDIRLSLFSLQTVSVPLLLFELPLAALFVWTLVDLVRKRWRPRGLISWLGALLVLVFIVSAIVHPSWFTIIRLYRFAASASLAYSLLHLLSRGGGKLLFLVATAAGVFQSYLAAGQHVLGKGLGYSFLGESDHLLTAEGMLPFANGTFPLHHILAAFTMVSLGLLLQAPVWQSKKTRWWWLIAVAGVAVAIGFTYSRMGALAWFAVVAILVFCVSRHSRRYLPIWAAILIGGVLPGVVGYEGWIAKTTETVQGDGPQGDDEGVDVGGRLKLAMQGIRVIERQPMFGTGIGRYLAVANDQQGDVQQFVHDVPLLIAAENGVLGGMVAVTLLAILGLVAARAGPLPLAAFVTYLPFVLFDHFPYEDTQGIALTGMWVAAITIGIQRESRR